MTILEVELTWNTVFAIVGWAVGIGGIATNIRTGRSCNRLRKENKILQSCIKELMRKNAKIERKYVALQKDIQVGTQQFFGESVNVTQNFYGPAKDIMQGTKGGSSPYDEPPQKINP